MLKDLTTQILKHTVISRRHLTPELALRLITPACPLWRATEDEVPFKDPFWAFYWPGGQATARYVTGKIDRSSQRVCAVRYILDNEDIFRNRQVLDVGCGCGAGAIAAAKMNAKRVLANDIDLYAVTATHINAELNKVAIETSTENLIGNSCDQFDTILIGDMFYDEDFANVLFEWLNRLRSNGKTVIIGDPGRHGLTEKRRSCMTLLAKYKLPQETAIENHGFTHTTLWSLNPN